MRLRGESMNKLRVIIKSPTEQVGHEQNIPDSLEMYQKIVDGNIEVVPVDDWLLIMNEEGKWRKGPNFIIFEDHIKDIIYGTVVVVGSDKSEFTDVPIDLIEWASKLNEWRKRAL